MRKEKESELKKIMRMKENEATNIKKIKLKRFLKKQRKKKKTFPSSLSIGWQNTWMF